MNIWANAVITQKGLALQAKLIEGTALNITRAETGAGYVTPGLLIQQEAVMDPRQSLTLKAVSYPETGKCAVPMYLTNDKVETGYTALQVGIYAMDPDEGEILYFIAQAADKDHGTIVPSATEMPGYNAEWTFYFQYGQADEVTVIVDPAGVLTYAEMVAYIDGEFIRITNEEIDLLADYPFLDGDGMAGVITNADIDRLTGISGGDGGDIDFGGDGTGGVYTLDHNLLYNRDAADQHTIESITGLEDALTSVEGENLGTVDIEAAWEATNEA